LKLTGRDARGRLGWNEIMRLFTLVLLHLLLQNGIFNSTHSYSLLHIHYSRIRIPSYLSFTAHTKYFNPPPLSSGFSPPPNPSVFPPAPCAPATHPMRSTGEARWSSSTRVRALLGRRLRRPLPPPRPRSAHGGPASRSSARGRRRWCAVNPSPAGVEVPAQE
jgi:hypothetical protein